MGISLSQSIEAMPVFAGTSFEQEGANSPNVITLAPVTIREGADKGSSGAKQKYVPVVASLPNNSQMSENYKLNTWMMKLIGMLLQQWTAIKDGLEVES